MTSSSHAPWHRGTVALNGDPTRPARSERRRSERRRLQAALPAENGFRKDREIDGDAEYCKRFWGRGDRKNRSVVIFGKARDEV